MYVYYNILSSTHYGPLQDCASQQIWRNCTRFWPTYTTLSRRVGIAFKVDDDDASSVFIYDVFLYKNVKGSPPINFHCQCKANNHCFALTLDIYFRLVFIGMK